MRYIKTGDFDEFTCIAGDCPASCCIGWQIGIDEESLLRYSEYEGGFGNYLRNAIDWERGCFLQYDGRCALLNEDDLCDLQLEKGEEALCFTCDQHPRHVEEFEGVREYSLDLSCPEVAAHYCKNLDRVEFLEYEDEEEDEEFDEFDSFLYSQLIKAREDLYSIIRNRESSLLCRMEEILAYADRLQNNYDKTGEADAFPFSEKESDDPSGILTLMPDHETDFEILSELERLNEEFTDILEKSIVFWSDDGVTETAHEKRDLSLLTEEESRAGENMLILLIYIYFCGSVYDDMIFSKAAAAVSMVRWILMINRAVGEKYQGLAGIAYRVCRQIEHTGDNFEKLEEYLNAKRTGQI